jgi:hypothetical protein
MKIRGSSEVRSGRILVNGVIGWERLAVIVFAVFFLLLYLQRSHVRSKHERAKNDILKQLYGLDENTPWTSAENRIGLAADILKNLAKYNETVPFTILAAAKAQLEAGKAAKDDYVETRAAQERQELDGSRMWFDILLPTFPAIGFIGTVSSLLVAMSQADRIVSTTDPFAKGLAASQVTDILSLCFSTTFLALCAVLLLSPLSIWQQSREHNLVDDVHRLIELVLRPGQ